MTKRHHVRINVQLPELTPAQADSFWNFLEDLSSQLWKAYESEILELEDYRSIAAELHDDSAADENEAHLDQRAAAPNLVRDSEPDTDF